MRQRRHALSSHAAGVLAIVLIGDRRLLRLHEGHPVHAGYELHAVFESSNNLRPGSPVRIAGVNVGKVKQSSATGTDIAVVTMEIEDDGLPIHSDATVKIRPRIFLEGNFFVDLRPGSPGGAGARRRRRRSRSRRPRRRSSSTSC